MKPPVEKLLTIYRHNLARYETEGDSERAAINRRLIDRMEKAK